jgi:hypothetical protein
MEMKNKTIILIVAVNLAALVLLAIFSPHLMISPGKPIEAHAELATDCFVCHTPFIGSTPEKCIACHKVAEIGIKTTKGLPIAKEKKNVAIVSLRVLFWLRTKSAATSLVSSTTSSVLYSRL